jgi:hypothetical protein
MRTLIALILTAFLAACVTNDGVTVKYEDKNDPGRVTSMSGLKSRDAANVANQSNYYNAKIKAPQKAIVSIKAHEGESITLSGVKEFTVWAPSTDDDKLAQPTLAPTEFAENVRALGSAVKDVASAATPIVGILEGGKTIRNGQNTALQAQQINATSNAAIASQGIEAAAKPPVIVGPSNVGVIYPNE